MTEPIDLTDKSKWADGWQTHNGKATAEIIKRLSDGRFVVVLTDGDGDEWVGTRFADGKCWRDYEDEYDLIPRPRKYTKWLNIFEQQNAHDFQLGHYAMLHLSLENANSAAQQDRIACIPVTFFEGDGLEDAK